MTDCDDFSAGVASVADVAWVTVQGDREYQQDAVRTFMGDDGSWMIAVADGTGGGINTEIVAAAAVAALPERIGSDREMLDAFAAANRAVRLHGTEYSRERMNEDLPAGWTRDPDTTLVVAAWTPENGLKVGWVGDSVAMVVPDRHSELPGWCCYPQILKSGAPLIGEFAAGDTVSEWLTDTISYLTDDIADTETDEMTAGGAIVVIMSDGAYNADDGDVFPYREHVEEARQFMPDDMSPLNEHADMKLVDRFLPAADRHRASDAVDAVMRRARRAGLHDNTTIAAARIAPVAQRPE